jgi:hypothetical protein
MDRTTSDKVGMMTIVVAAIFALAVVVAIYLLLHPGAEVTNPTGTASNAVTANAQTTPDLKGDTRSNLAPAPPDATGSGPSNANPR